MKFKRTGAAIMAVAIAGGLVACSSSASSSSSTAADGGASAAASGAAAGGGHGGLKISVVTHGQASDPYWSVVKNGVAEAQTDTGDEVTYQAPQKFDMVEMSRLIDAEVAKKPDGLVISIPDAAALKDSVTAAVAAGIPVLVIDSGPDAAKELGTLGFVGTTSYENGVAAGKKFLELGAKNILCVNHEQGNGDLEDRCRGLKDGIGADGTVTSLAVSGQDPTDVQQKVQAALSAGNVDGVLALGPLGADPSIAAIDALGKAGQVKLATFDLSPEVLQSITDGKMEFAVDSQQWLMGYLPIIMLDKYKKYGVLPGPGMGGVLTTGPNFVTKDNAAQVIELSKAGIR
jgi:simple sugar transport system substrate-binding protein